MKQLSGLDASFLNMETSTNFGHVSSLILYDVDGVPGGAGVEAVKQSILERIDQLAPLRRRLIEVPLGLDNPYWIEDPEFDLDFHVRHHAVPPPGTREQLGDVISRIVGRPLDRSRPLWEYYVIEGIDGGLTVGHLNKLHHCTIDGASGAIMLAALLDTEPDAAPRGAPATWTPDSVPTDAELLSLTLREYVRRPEKLVRQTVRTLRDLAGATQSGGLKAIADLAAQPIPGPLGGVMRRRLRSDYGTDVDKPPALPPTRAPRTPWNRPVTAHRRFAFTSISLDEAKTVRRAFGCTFNDVVMALCASTLRTYLLRNGELPDDPLIAMVPVSVRSGSESDTYENRVSALLANLATDNADPVARLREIAASMEAAKAQFATIPAETLQDFTQFAPPAVAARALRMASRLRLADRLNPPFNLIISNVPGPNMALYSAGAAMKHFYPVSTIVDGQGLNMTVQSYNGSLDFGLIACRELVPDLWDMIPMLQDAMMELSTAAHAATVAPASAASAASPASAASAASVTSAASTASATGRKTPPRSTTKRSARQPQPS